MKYAKSKEADKKVEADLKIIKKIIIEELNPESLILFGGFGRGEGSFEIKNKKIIPLNDYDMYVVTKKKISDEKLEEVGKKASNAIGKGGGEFVENYKNIYDREKYFHVDLRWLDYNNLKNLRRINRTYELKYGSTIIYGEDVRKKIPDIKIPLSESFRYLINPFCHLLLVMDKRRLNGEFRKDEKFYMQHHIVKSYLAIASSLIISEGKFEADYTSTVKEFNRLYKTKFPKLVKKVNEALKLKTLSYKPVSNLNERWFQARDDLYFVLAYLAKKHLKIESKNVKELTEKIYQKLPYVFFTPYLPLPRSLAKIAFPSQYFLNILYFKRTKKLKVLLNWRDAGLRIFISAILLLYSIDNKELIDEAYKNIKIFSNVKTKNWEDLREGLLYGFDKYFSQKLI